jgi:hypothetical protein
MLKNPDTTKLNHQSEELRGIEKFVVANDKCTQTNSNTFLGKLRLLKGFATATIKSFISGKQKAAAQTEVQRYIGKLFKVSQKQGRTGAQKKALIAMENTLKKMVYSDPKRRPSMSYCLEMFKQYFKEYQGS